MIKKNNLTTLIFYLILVLLQSFALFFVAISQSKGYIDMGKWDIFSLIFGLFLFNYSLLIFLFPKINEKFNIWKIIKKEKRKFLFIPILLISIALLIASLFITINTTILFISGMILFTLTFSYLRISTELPERDSKRFKFNRWDTLAVVIIGVFALLCSYKIGEFMSVDEPKWIKYRLYDYFEGWQDGDIALTNINDKPGILPTLISGAFSNTGMLRVIYWTGTPQDVVDMMVGLRIPLVIFISIGLLIVYLLLRNIYSQRFSLVSILLLSLTPPIIGISRIINPDATIWITLLIFFLSILNAYKKEDFRFYILAGIFFGFALLSKFTAVPFLVLPLIYIFLTSFMEKKSLYYQILGLFFSTVVGLLVFSSFYPYVLHDFSLVLGMTFFIKIQSTTSILILLATILIIFIYTIEPLYRILKSFIDNINWKLISKILLFILGLFVFTTILLDYIPNNLFNINAYIGAIEKENSFRNNLFYDMSIQSFTQSTITIITLIVGSFLFLFKNKHDDRNFPEIISFILFIFIFYITSTLFSNIQLIIRYQIYLYPLFILLASFLIEPYFKKTSFFVIFMISALILSGYEIYDSAPYYLNYQNILKNEESPYLTESWGIGGYDMALYIDKNISEKYAVWPDREGICEFISNECEKRDGNPFERNGKYDYLVLTPMGYKIMMTDEEVKNNKKLVDLWEYYYNEKEPVYEVYVNNSSTLYFKLVKIDPDDKIF